MSAPGHMPLLNMGFGAATEIFANLVPSSATPISETLAFIMPRSFFIAPLTPAPALTQRQPRGCHNAQENIVKEILNTLGMGDLLASAQEAPATLTEAVGAHAENPAGLLDAAQTLLQDPTALAPEALAGAAETASNALGGPLASAQETLAGLDENAQNLTQGLAGAAETAGNALGEPLAAARESLGGLGEKAQSLTEGLSAGAVGAGALGGILGTILHGLFGSGKNRG